MTSSDRRLLGAIARSQLGATVVRYLDGKPVYASDRRLGNHETRRKLAHAARDQRVENAAVRT